MFKKNLAVLTFLICLTLLSSKMHDNENNNSLYYLVVGFIFRFLEGLVKYDDVLGVVVKITSLLSFMIFLFLNYPRIKIRIIQAWECQITSRFKKK